DGRVAEVAAAIKRQALVATFEIHIGVLGNLPLDERSNHQALAIAPIVVLEIDEAVGAVETDLDGRVDLPCGLQEDRVDRTVLQLESGLLVASVSGCPEVIVIIATSETHRLVD